MPELFQSETSGSHPNASLQKPGSGPVRHEKPPATGESEIKSSLLSLLSPDEQKRFSDISDHAGTEALPFVARLLARERARRKSRSINLRTVSALLTVCTVLGFPFLLTILGPSPTAAAVIVALSLARSLAQYDPQGRLEQAAFAYLLQIDDSRSVGLLLERVNVGSPDDRTRVREALIERLPQFGAEEAALLTPDQRTLFYSIMDSPYASHIELRLAAIAALERVGERYSLGMLRRLAGGEAASRGEQAVRTAAQKRLYELQGRLDFGRPENIPVHLSKFHPPTDSQLSSEIVYADNLYALIALLPQLTPANYRQILSAKDRDRLYALLYPATMGQYGYDKLKLYREVVRALERVGDTRAMDALRQVALMEAPTDGTKQLRAAAKEALGTLRRVLANEKVSRTLLRGSSAPDALPGELLRAAAPAESETDPNELLRASTQQKSVTVPADLPPVENRNVLLQRPEDPGR